ncbi:hypothetical protein ZWY2020_059681 [Hordeum vulgare]|nr:hypothetical protein ZWY2020_059681 [Hordeum vulgare]
MRQGDDEPLELPAWEGSREWRRGAVDHLLRRHHCRDRAPTCCTGRAPSTPRCTSHVRATRWPSAGRAAPGTARRSCSSATSAAAAATPSASIPSSLPSRSGPSSAPTMPRPPSSMCPSVARSRRELEGDELHGTRVRLRMRLSPSPLSVDTSPG